jgi:tRNA-Thr(GGU) m(6)t(6)A37 methyltransferase TsaA
MDLTLRPIGYVRSPLTDPETAPRFETAGAPPSELVLEPDMVPGLEGLEVGTEIFVLTWLHLADRTCRRVHPRGNPDLPMRGVFSTRSPSRPNPVGLHKVRITAMDGPVVTVDAMEAIDGTPIIDLKIADGHQPQADETTPARP